MSRKVIVKCLSVVAKEYHIVTYEDSVFPYICFFGARVFKLPTMNIELTES